MNVGIPETYAATPVAVPVAVPVEEAATSDAPQGWFDALTHAVAVGSTYWRRALARPDWPAAVLTDTASWLALTTQRQVPTWSSTNSVVSSSSTSRLRDFTPTGARAGVPTLILPPQAGHHSCIVDFSPRQSQVAIAIEAGLDRVFALEWLEATAETRHASIATYVAAVRAAIAEIGGPVNLIGDCQGGWLAALYAALEPQDVATLTVGGAPIDFHAGEAAIALYVGLVGSYDGIAPYRALVDAGGGLLRGELMLGGFVALRPEAELRKQLELLLHLDDPEFVRRYVEFEDWFKHTQDIAGEFYLWIVDRLFLRNELIHGTLTVEDRVVDLAAITCPTTIIAGTRDHITPPPQAFALAAHVATPAADIVTDVVDAGHLGLFMGRAALRGHWLPHLHRIAAAQDAAR